MGIKLLGMVRCRRYHNPKSKEKGKSNYREVITMIYNPIFEEEIEKKTEFKQLRKAIKRRARKETISSVISRVYNLLTRKPILTLVSLFNSSENLVKTLKR